MEINQRQSIFRDHIINYTYKSGDEQSSKYVSDTPNSAFYSKDCKALVAFDPNWEKYSTPRTTLTLADQLRYMKVD